jgi:hypothetical protein
VGIIALFVSYAAYLPLLDTIYKAAKSWWHGRAPSYSEAKDIGILALGALFVLVLLVKPLTDLICMAGRGLEFLINYMPSVSYQLASHFFTGLKPFLTSVLNLSVNFILVGWEKVCSIVGLFSRVHSVEVVHKSYQAAVTGGVPKEVEMVPLLRVSSQGALDGKEGRDRSLLREPSALSIRAE